MRYNQKELLKSAALIAIALALAFLASGPAAWAQPPPLVRVVQVTSPGVMTDTGPDPARVLEMVKRGLLEITGQTSLPAAWARFVRPQDVVGLKISALGGNLPGTHREVVLAIAQTLQESGLRADQIVIWDREQAGLAQAGWPLADEASNLRVLASDVFGYDEDGTYCLCDPPDEQGDRRSHFSRILTQRITRLINVPSLAWDAHCGMSMGLTNLAFGVSNNVARGYADHCAKFVPAVFAQPMLQRPLTLVIADALRPQYGRDCSQAWNCDSLLFAVGQPSADAIGLAILDGKRQELGLPPLEQTEDRPDYLAAIQAAGLGITDLSQIKWDKVEM